MRGASFTLAGQGVHPRLHSFFTDVRKAGWCSFLLLFVGPLTLTLSLCGVSKARPDELPCQRECSSEGGEALFLRERCIFLLSTGIAASASPWTPLPSPSFPLTLLLLLSIFLSLLHCFLSGAVQRTDWGYYFSSTVYFLPCSDTEGPILVLCPR